MGGRPRLNIHLEQVQTTIKSGTDSTDDALLGLPKKFNNYGLS